MNKVLTDLGESQEKTGDCALLYMQGKKSVSHVDEEHCAPDASIGRPWVTV